MPWKQSVHQATIDALESAAHNGQMVPYRWVERVEHDEAGRPQMRGCAWGIIGWAVASALAGAAAAEGRLPVGCRQRHVNYVLRQAGLTRREIRAMAPHETWRHFDEQLADAFAARYEDPAAYYQACAELATYFTRVINRVAVVDEGGVVVQVPPPPPPTYWQLFVAELKEELQPMPQPVPVTA